MDDKSKQAIPNSGKSTQTLINVAVLLLVLATSIYVVYQVRKLSAGSSAPDKSQNTSKPPSGNSESLQGLANSLNLSALPPALDFGKQMTGTTSGVQTVTLTAKPDASVSITVISPTDGNFVVFPSGCDLEPSASCALTVTFAPKHIQRITSSLTITAVAKPVPAPPNNAGPAPNLTPPPTNPLPATPNKATSGSGLILLTGEGTANCPITGPVFPNIDWLTSKIPLLLVVLGFLAVLILVRWNMLAVPTRRLALAAIESVKARVKSLSDPTKPGVASIEKLLSNASDVVTDTNQHLRGTLADHLFWNRGQEIAAWNYVHEAEEQLVSILPADSVRAALERAESDLRQAGTPPAVALADRIRDALVATPGLSVDAWRPVLHQVLTFLTPLSTTLADRVAKALTTTPTPDDCKVLLKDLASALEPQGTPTLTEKVEQALKGVKELQPLLEKASGLVGPKSAAMAEKIKICLTSPPTTTTGWTEILQETRDYLTPQTKDLAESIRQALAAEPAVPIGRWKALLYEALGLLYDRTDTSFSTLISWHNKTMYLVGCGLLLIVSLDGVLGHGELFLLGAAGGLLSRLTRTLFREDVPTDYGASWTTLFLSPVVGALMGWAGILLVILGTEFNILGSALKVDWCNTSSPMALALAFLLGFSERAFTGILSQLEQKVQAKSAASQPTPGATLSITTAAALPQVKVGEKYAQPLAASGGTLPYKWERTGGQLPPGLNLDSSGQISGTPTTAGTLTFTVQVTDAASNTKSQAFTITVA